MTDTTANESDQTQSTASVEETDDQAGFSFGPFSPEFMRHMRAAEREMLLAVRSALDWKIDALEDKPQQSKRRSQRISVS